MQRIDILMSLAGGVLVIWLAGVLAHRKLYREYPLFFSYIVFSVLSTAVRLSAAPSYKIFFYTYWISESIYSVLALLALHEVFRHVFLSFYSLWWWFRLVFPGAVALMSFIAIRNAVRHPALQGPRFMEVIFALAKGVNYLEAVLFGLFFALVLLLGVRWRSQPFGIVEGFGVSALGALLAFGLRSEFGTKYNTFARYAPPVAYVLGVLVWLDTFLRAPEPEVVHAWRNQITPEQLLAEAKAYISFFKRLFGRYNDL